MRKNTPLALAVSTTLGLAAAGLSSTVAAQELEEVMVTGSRIATADGFGQVAPVSVVSAEDIKLTGMTRLEDVLNSLPSVEAAQNSFISNGATGTASLDLRGLGANRTLVLFNGKRLQPGGVNTQTVDINQIPAAIVERVEVLTGGASATYGADAVAGVVNFITRRVNGLEISAGAGGYQHKNDNGYIQGRMDARGFDYPTGSTDIDGRSYTLDVLMGSDFADGRGNATVYATWREGDGVLEAQRDYSNCALSNSGTSCGGSSTAPIPNFFIAPLTSTFAGIAPTDPVTGLAYDYSQSGFYSLQLDGSLAPYNGTNIYNFAPINYFMRPDERYSLGAFVDYEVNEHFTPYMEVNYTSSSSRAQIAQSGTFYADTYFLDIDDPLIPAAFAASLASLYPGYDRFGFYIGKRNVEGGPRSEITDYDSFRLVGGTRGQLTDSWSYDLFWQLGKTASSSIYINDLFLPNLREALDSSVCGTGGALPCYNVFVPNGVTSEMAAGLSATAVATGDTSTEVMGGYVTGDLGFGLPGADNIQAVFGFEHRMERYDRIADQVYQDGALAGQGGPTPNLKGGYNVMEYFTEFSVPVLENLTLDAAYRFSDYSTAGGTDTYRVGLDWQAIDQVRVRAGYNRAVRAPNIGELFAATQIGLWGGNDPCAGDLVFTDGNGDGVDDIGAPEYTQAQCANTGVTAAQYGNIAPNPADQYNQVSGGNVNLKPEKADTITFGVVVTPIDSLTFSVDYWSIEIEDSISTLGPRLIIDQCALFGQLCSSVVRAGNGSLWQGQAGFVRNTLQNFGQATWEGVDVAASWRTDALGGSIGVNFIGTYMLTKEVLPIPTDKTTKVDCVGVISSGCFPQPEVRFTLSANYDSNEWWAAGASLRFMQGTKYEGTVDTLAQKEAGSDQVYIDLNGTFRFMENSDVVVGVRNVMDEEPPLLGGTLSTNANTVAGFYDTLGRYLFMKATLRF